ncbi:efflux RND transporter permease subunit [Hoeflea sp.]|uniref:efflux RND transporter permease subunit n=1 Tax=Hoeflea sp. TaxID=1940281 RepID=UPI003B0273DE
MKQRLITLALDHPKIIFRLTVAMLAVLICAIALPFAVPEAPLHKLRIDTDPENMLQRSEPARILNRDKSDRFALHDRIVIAIENDRTQDGVFTPAALADIRALADFAAGIEGVVAAGITAPGTTDIAQRAANGSVDIAPLMRSVPDSQEEAASLRQLAAAQPILDGTLVSHDSAALAISIPIEDKGDGFRVTRALQDHIETLPAGNRYHITGLPVAQSVFGIEMFVQMAIAAPAAMLLIFFLLFGIFRSWWVASVPLGIAMVSSLGAMGALIASGNTVHIMSSMIPIFVMPIAVMDAIHVLSEFADKHSKSRDRKETIRACMDALWQPMLFTTVTTMVGFASLALAPIPPVQVFGLFVALGVGLAWLATMAIVPAAMMKLPEAAIDRIVSANRAAGTHWLAKIALGQPRFVLLCLGMAALVLFMGLDRIRINDSPMRWFASDHEVRVAERVLTDRFAGAHMAYLSLEASRGAFESPEMLAYVAALGDHLERSGEAGKTLALPDVVTEAYRAVQPDPAARALPETRGDVAAILRALEDEGMARDLRTFVTPDFAEAVLHVWMPDGDNLAMRELERAAAAFMSANRPPEALRAKWFGLTYLNAVWQDRMVTGMLHALIGSFIAVFMLLVILFRSLSWAVLAMVPLTFSIGGIYGAIGWLGRDFDMPIAVLSTLSLGLAVDFAIHFVSRVRQDGELPLPDRLARVYQEPVRAIQRNTIVLGIGFLPLLASPLIPYRTVGTLIPAIIVISAIATVVFLGAALALRRTQMRAAPALTAESQLR